MEDPKDRGRLLSVFVDFVFAADRLVYRCHSSPYQDLKREGAQFALNHFDFFSIDLGEELSAFNGNLLADQSAFVGDCIAAVLKLYEASIPEEHLRPKSVILLGHSMGGVVARSVFNAPTYRPGTVRTILTLNSPHISAPILFHRSVHNFYTRVNDHWRRNCDNSYELQQTAVVSIAGGLRDTQVHASLSNLDSIIPCKNHISVISTSIPDVWVSLDHTSCMWCNQFVTVISAALTGLIDPTTLQAHDSLELRLSNLRRYFHSTVPAALQLDSPFPHLTPPVVHMATERELQHAADPRHLNTSISHASSKERSDSSVKERSQASSTSKVQSEASVGTNDASHAEDRAAERKVAEQAVNATLSASHYKDIGNDDGGQHATDESDESTLAQSYSWVSALPVETNRALMRASANHLSKFQVKWDLFHFPQYSHLQMVTTAPLDDLAVLLCDEAGLQCLDLTKTAAPMPYAIRQVSYQKFSTQKAHVIVTSLKDYIITGESTTYRFLVVSSVHQHRQWLTGHVLHHEEPLDYDAFMVAQLTVPVEIMALNGDWSGETAYSLGSNVVSHMTLLDANKYLLYHARVVQHECASHPLMTPLLLEYSPAMREERYEQKHLSLRFHEQFLSYNYQRSTEVSISDSIHRIPMKSQEALHIFVFTDPICTYSVHLRPDWYATVDVMLRNFGVLVIGGIFVLSVLLVALQLRHAETNPTKDFKSVFSIIAYILTSFWIVGVVTVYCIPARFSGIFDMFSSPWLQSHSFAMMAKPWPSELSGLILIITSLVTMSLFATIGAIVMVLTHKVPELVRKGYNYVVSNGGAMHTPPQSAIPVGTSVVLVNGISSMISTNGSTAGLSASSSSDLMAVSSSNVPSPSITPSPMDLQSSSSYSTSSGLNGSNSSLSSSSSSAGSSGSSSLLSIPTSAAFSHRRSPSIDNSPSSSPMNWIPWCIACPKTVVVLLILLAAIAILLHSCVSVALALIILVLPLRTDFPMTNSQSDSMFNMRHAIFVLYFPSLVLLVPDMIVWLNNAHFDYHILDSYERLAIIMAAHVLLLRYTAPSVTLQRHSLVHWFLLAAVGYLLIYALFPVYRALDALFFVGFALCVEHCYKAWTTPPDRAFKSQ